MAMARMAVAGSSLERAGALLRAGRLDDAERAARTAVADDSVGAEARYVLGLIRLRAGRPEAAIAPLRQALRLDPDHTAALSVLAEACSKLDRPAELVAACRELVGVRPDHAEALHRMGEALGFLGDHEASLACFREAERLMPASPSVANGLGAALGGLGRDAEAMAHLRRAVLLHPDYPEAQNHLGRVLHHSGAFEAALAHLDEAIRLRPEFIDAHHNRGLALHALRRFEEAASAYDRAIALAPDHALARTSRALVDLILGDFDRGWRGFAWRWDRPGCSPPLPGPPWRGEPLDGRTILLAAEQGAGDVIQMIRYAPQVKARGAAEVLLYCPGSLRELLGTCPGIDRIVSEVPESGFEVQAPLSDLPAALETTPDTIPAPIPYLSADPARAARWRERLEGFAGFRVGVAWHGNPNYPSDRERSFPLGMLAPLAAIDGVRLIGLQKGPGSEQARDPSLGFPIVDFGDDLDPGPGAFLDSAAIAVNLDLVISADTAAAHLCGALGVPTWLPLSTAADWRWSRTDETSAWYPSARLFRQDRPRDWAPVFARMADALADLVAANPPRARPCVVEVAAGELIDKITILSIKAERIADPAKLEHVRAELAHLELTRERLLPPWPRLAAVVEELRRVNEAIWDVEERLREAEDTGDFGPEFVALARSVYRNNDRRAALKRIINDSLGSRLIEEKSYPVDRS